MPYGYLSKRLLTFFEENSPPEVTLLKKLITLSLLGSLAFTNIVVAETPINLNFDLGMTISQLSKNTTVTPTNGLTKSYTADTSPQYAPFIGVGAEYVFDSFTAMPIAMGLGLSAYYVGLGKLSGTEVPGSNLGLTDTLNYSMDASSAVIMFEPRLIYTAHPLQPYVIAGAGYAWNTLSNFAESTPSDGNAAASNPYGSHTEHHVSYELGLGAQYALRTPETSNLTFHVEYRFIYLGDAQLGAADGQSTSERLSSRTLSTHIIDCGLGYKFQ